MENQWDHNGVNKKDAKGGRSYKDDVVKKSHQYEGLVARGGNMRE